MIKIKKLYSEPSLFTPIEFTSGVNLILGERVEENEIRTKKDRKTNGVGKTMCIEFINFCLLSSSTDSRVMRIPFDKMPLDTKIMLDLSVGGHNITIIRDREEPEKPIILSNKDEIHFNSLNDASEYLNKLLHSTDKETVIHYPTFRELLGPLIRKEGSEFKDILRCYDTSRNTSLPNLSIPHLYFFRIDFTIVEKLQKHIKEIEKMNNYYSTLEKELTQDKKKKVSEVKAEVNSLNDELQKVEKALESFKTNEAYEAIQKDLTKLENQLDLLRTEQAAIRIELGKIESLPKLEVIRQNEVEQVYNQFKEGLGTLIAKSLDEVTQFKTKIDEFQKNLINEKLLSLRERLDEVTKQIRTLEDIQSEKINIIDKKGVLKDIRNAYTIYNNKHAEFSKVLSQIELYEATKRELDALNLKRDEYFLKLGQSIYDSKQIIDDFNLTILSIHDFIMGNKKASFEIKTINSKRSTQIIELELRIDDDGSHSIDRTKVFIYDLSLLFNKYTRERHPKFLIHDNILEVDQDTLVQSLNYLSQQENRYDDFQYILTLNRDKIQFEEQQKLIKLDIEGHKKAEFTRQNKFLNFDYQEL